MRSVQVYVEGQRLELYKDEQITVQSEQQNIKDIQSVKTDYSQTFTIPTTPNNNKIFKHFYESSLDSNTDHNIRRSASIEIDLIPFRKGEIQIEKSQLKKGQAESYSVTFYGEVVALKDKFGDELLSDIAELSNESYSYTQANVLAEIQDDSLGAVKFPLVIDRTVSYATGDSDDISHSGSGAIHTDELFPAVNMLTLFNTLQTRYGITFSGTFFSDDRFRRAYLHCKNSNNFQFISEAKDIPLTNLSVSNLSNQNLTLTDFYNNGELTLQTQDMYVMLPTQSTYLYATHRISVEVFNLGDVNTTWFLDVYQNGSLYTTLTGMGNSTSLTSCSLVFDNYSMSTEVFTFKVRTDRAVSIGVRTAYIQSAYTATGLSSNQIFSESQVVTSASLDVTQYIPNMKVIDFFKGVLNMFNLTCYGLGNDTYQIEPLDEWYQKGAIVDITPHVDIDTIDVNRVPLYKNIDFQYKPSKSITNEAFRSLFSRDFGNARSSFTYDGGEYKVELPFSNLMFNRFTGTDLQVGFNVDTESKPYTPEPSIFYMNTYLNADFNVNDGNAHYNLTGYVPFGQDVKYQGGTSSLNFSADYSTLLNEPSQVNLFSSFYFPYLSNLYNLKNRNVSLKAILPVSLITSLELNDRLIIRDKRYIINSMNTNVTNGEVSLDLIQDFRATLSETGVPPIDVIKPDNSAQCLDIRVLLPNKCVSASISGSANITSITPTTITEDSTITVCIPENSADLGRILTEDSLFNLAVEDGSGDDVLQEESASSSEQVYLLTITYTFQNGSTSSSQQIITQEP